MFPTTGKKIWFVVTLLFITASILVWDGLYRLSTADRTRTGDPAGITVLEHGGRRTQAAPAVTPRAPRVPKARPAARPVPAQDHPPQDRPRLRTPEPSRVWTVRRGQSLYEIAAECYGRPVRWKEIAVANGIGKPWVIRPGQTLRIPR